jgi:hypothetical protein
MTDSNEEVLRRSLDAVDRHRNRLIIGFVVSALFLFGALVQGTYAARSGSINLFTHAAMIVVVVWTTMVGLGIVIQITVMTKRILRAIELASRK